MKDNPYGLKWNYFEFFTSGFVSHTEGPSANELFMLILAPIHNLVSVMADLANKSVLR